MNEVKRVIEDVQNQHTGNQLELAWLTVFEFCCQKGMTIEGEESGLELVLNFINNLTEV